MNPSVDPDRDFFSDNKSKKDHFQEMLDDNQERESLLGHTPDELGEDYAYNFQNDEIGEESLSRVHSDEDLERVIRELLKNSNRLDASDITVTVDNAHVRLSGTVKSQEERDYAEDVVKLVHGVGEIEIDLIVKTTGGILPTDIGRNP